MHGDADPLHGLFGATRVGTLAGGVKLPFAWDRMLAMLKAAFNMAGIAIFSEDAPEKAGGMIADLKPYPEYSMVKHFFTTAADGKKYSTNAYSMARFAERKTVDQILASLSQELGWSHLEGRQ